MAGIAVPPGRAGRLWLRRRLETATHAVELLERELAALHEHHTRAVARCEQTGAEWDRLAGAARAAHLQAQLAVGARGLGVAVDESTATVEITWKTVMGARIPSDSTCTIPPPGPAAVACSATVVASRAAHRVALEAAARHAVAAEAERRLAEQADVTRQRVRALTHRWLPQLTEALRLREMELEEQERQDRIAGRRSAAGPCR